MSSNTVDFLLTTKDLQTVKQRTMNVSSVTYYKKNLVQAIDVYILLLKKI